MSYRIETVYMEKLFRSDELLGKISFCFGVVPIPESIIVTDGKERLKPIKVTGFKEIIFEKYISRPLTIIFLEDDEINKLKIDDLDSLNAIQKALENVEKFKVFLYNRSLFYTYKMHLHNSWVVSPHLIITPSGKLRFFDKPLNFNGICILKEWLNEGNKLPKKSRTIPHIERIIKCSNCHNDFSINDILNANIVLKKRTLRHKKC